MFVDLLFPAVGDSVPVDHAYPLYSALSRLVPAFHDPAARLRFTPLSGLRGEPGRLRLTDRSCLRVRLPADTIPTALPLAGKAVEVGGAPVRFGPPSVHALRPAAMLAARLVIFKNSREPDAFLANVKEKLASLEISGNFVIPSIDFAPRLGEPRRRVIRIRKRVIVGYALTVSGLTAEHSIKLQESSFGGRQRMGCGFFLPVREGK